MPEPTSHTLDVPGAVLAYDVRGDSRTNEPPLLLIAAPMGAAGFATLAGHFSDRMVEDPMFNRSVSSGKRAVHDRRRANRARANQVQGTFVNARPPR
jgi:hypothetical protein